MGMYDFLLLFLALVSLWFFWRSLKSTAKEVKQIRRCTIKLTARILSWRREEYSDEADWYIPTICYQMDGREFETEFRQGALTKFQLDRREGGDTMVIFADPHSPESICPENKAHAIFRSVEGCLVVCGICLLFILVGIVVLVARLR